jgi:hypothetical protein
MCSKSRIIVSIEATLRAFSFASKRFRRSVASRGFIVRYPQRVRTGHVQTDASQKNYRLVILARQSKRRARLLAAHDTRLWRNTGSNATRRLQPARIQPDQLYIKALSCGKATRKSVLVGPAPSLAHFASFPPRGRVANQLENYVLACRGVGWEGSGAWFGLPGCWARRGAVRPCGVGNGSVPMGLGEEDACLWIGCPGTRVFVRQN